MEFKQTFVVTIENGKVSVVDEIGNEPPRSELTWLASRLAAYYPPEKYVYIGNRQVDGQRLCKIGVTRNPYRRMHELKLDDIHQVACTKYRVWSYERDLHQRLHKWRRQGEWFDLPKEIEGGLRSAETESELRAFIFSLPMPPFEAYQKRKRGE